MSLASFEQEVRSHVQKREALSATQRSKTYGSVPTQADYQAAKDEFAIKLSRLEATNSFSTSETVTPQIAKHQGEAWLAYLDKKAQGS